MPPQRTWPTVKPVKTERTHEENQERAYIAASRRSDRSLEARVESARRASEIHKRRTGRALRVTEQDVINEEMYEEEDDDLPNQYRRLTAHIQTESAEFNRRLAAYITNHVAMRSALNEAVNGNFNSHYPNAPQFAHNNSMFPSPLMTQGLSQQQAMQSPTTASPHTPHSYRHTPYPMPGHPQYRPHQQQQRAMSIQMPPQGIQMPAQMSPMPGTPGAHMVQQMNQQPQMPFRRSSVPVIKREPDVSGPEQLPSPQSDTSPRGHTPAAKFPFEKPGSAPASVTNVPVGQTLRSQPAIHQPQPQHPGLFQRTERPHSIDLPSNNFASYNMHQQNTPSNPLTLSLPPNDQQIINPATIIPGTFGEALMGGPDAMFNLGLEGFAASDAGSMLKPGAHFHPNLQGMNSTLAPEDPWKQGAMTSAPMYAGLEGTATPANFDMYFNFGGDGSNAASAAGTPGAGAGTGAGASFSEFLDTTNWNENST